MVGPDCESATVQILLIFVDSVNNRQRFFVDGRLFLSASMSRRDEAEIGLSALSSNRCMRTAETPTSDASVHITRGSVES